MSELTGKTIEDAGENRTAHPDVESIGDPPAGPAAGNGVTDSMLNAAYAFEAQLEQMTNWKHQLSQQMELMRRDGVKLLERQKNLAVEKQRLAAERETLTGDRAYVQKLHAEVEDKTRRLSEEGDRIGKSLSELKMLEQEKTRWDEELANTRAAAAAAIHEADLARRRKDDFEAAVAGAEARLAEFKKLEARRQELQTQVTAAEATLKALHEESTRVDEQRKLLDLKTAELAAKELAIKELERAQGESRKAAQAEIASERQRLAKALKAVEEGRREIVRDREGLAKRMTEIEAARNQADAQALEVLGGAEKERAEAGKMMAEARGVIEQMTTAQQQLDQREKALAEAAAELGSAKTAMEAKGRELQQREAAAESLRQECVAAKGVFATQEEGLAAREREIHEKLAGAQRDLDQRIAAAEKAKVEAEAQRDSLARQREEIEKKLDLMEGELAEQFEAVAKQTKRLTERRADLDARSAGVDKEIELRIHRATVELQQELAEAQRTYEERIEAFKEQVERNEAQTSAWKEREAELQRKAALAGEEAAQLNVELMKLQGELESAQRGGAEHAQGLAELQSRFDREAKEWRQRAEQAANQASAAAGDELLKKEAERLRKQIEMLEQQRQDLVGQVFAAQEDVRRAAEAGLMAKNAMEGELVELRSRNQRLEAAAVDAAKHAATQAHASSQSQSQPPADNARSAGQRNKLLRQARSLRAYRKQVQVTKGAMLQHSEDIAREREQLRSRKENLEQVKRLLEKQEMVMARKLADHNALKTVAAVGIFLIMILGSVFLGVYKFVNPTYRSEAVVQLAPPDPLQGADLKAWMMRQADFVRSPEVTFEAWKILRSDAEHYGMHDVREEWVASLTHGLTMEIDGPTKRMSIDYSGPNADGVTQVCNALATAYVTPGTREATDPRGQGAAPTILAKAAKPDSPAKDNRFVMSLSLSATVMFLSLILVIVFRHYVSRQLREIDRMADEQDLADLKGELA